MIQIKNISGTTIIEAPITDSCEYVRELMKDDYVKLSFSHDTLIPLKEGSYIEYNGIKYSLLEPYEPAYKTEINLLYEPAFHSPVSAWKKQTLFYTEQGLEEVDWTGTMTPVQFLSVIVGNLKKYRGDIYTLAIDSELTGSKNIAFQSTSIFEALDKIAQAWETEWWVDGTVINLGKCSYGTPVKLESGVDTSIPSISASNDGYFTRFYAFGSTRNITQDYDSGSVQNHIIQKRLKLPVSKYPNGYMDIRPNLRKGEIFTKTLIFDDIYPSSNLTVSETRAEVKFYLDGQGNKIEIGKDTSGQPIYKTYSIWYIKLGSFIFDESSIIEGLDLTAKFETGQLITREFKLVHRNGEYEILFDESEGFVIPGEVSLIPAVGDKVVLFNIKMPQEYISSAEFKLEKELKKIIQKQSVDTNTYSFDSNPVEFNKTSLRLEVGQKISFVYQGRTIDTRVLSVRMRLDFPDIQNISIGDVIPKGTTSDLRQQVANANENIEIIKTLNDLRNDITNSYGHAQKELAEGFAKWGKLWTLEKDSRGNDYVFSSLPIAVQGGVTMFADAGVLDLPSIYEEIPLGDGLIWKDGRLVVTVNGGLDEAALGNYLTTYKYATQIWVTSRLSNLHAHSNKSVLDTITSGNVGNWDTAFGWGNHATAGYALNSALSSHVNDAVKHITTAERNTWNAKENALGRPSANRYLLSSTTSGIRSWVKPYELTKDDVVRVLKDADGCIRLDASMLLSGGMTMLSDLGFSVPSIFDNVPIATATSKGMLDNSILGTGLSWVGGKLTATATAGTFDHTALSNRNSNNQHNIAAITGLQVALDSKSPIHSHPYRPDTWMPTAAQIGAAAAVHGHDILFATDNRTIKPNSTNTATNRQIRPFFTRLDNFNITSAGTYADCLVYDTYSDNSGGLVNATLFPKNAGYPRMFLARGAWNGDSWTDTAELFTDKNSNIPTVDWNAKNLAAYSTIKLIGDGKNQFAVTNEPAGGAIQLFDIDGTRQALFRGYAVDGVQLELQAGGIKLNDSAIYNCNAIVSNRTNGFFIGNAASGLGSGNTGGLFYAYGNNPLHFWTNGASRMYIRGDGFTGFGTTNPLEKVHINGNLRIDKTVRDTLIHGNQQNLGSMFVMTDATRGANAGVLVGMDADGSGVLWHRGDFRLRFGTNGLDRMQIKSNGAVAIAGDEDDGRFTVHGRGIFTYQENSTGLHCGLRIKNTGWIGDMNTGIEFWNGRNKSTPTARIDDVMEVDGSSGGCLRFFVQRKGSTNPNNSSLMECMRIADRGMIGIGMTTGISARVHILGISGHWTMAMKNPSTVGGSSYGLLLDAGASAGDSALRIRNAAQNAEYLHVRGDGNIGIGTAVANYKLTIGDSDSGFHWHSDGLLSGYANGVQVWNWNSQRIHFNTLIEGDNSCKIKGDIFAGTSGAGHVFFRPACAGYAWNNGLGALTVDIRNNPSQTPLLLARREGGANSGADRLFAIELLNSGGHLYFQQRGSTMLRFVNNASIYLDKPTRVTGSVSCNNEFYSDAQFRGASTTNNTHAPFRYGEQLVSAGEFIPLMKSISAMAGRGYWQNALLGIYRSGDNFGAFQVRLAKNDNGSAWSTLSFGADGLLHVGGNILADGGITMLSDMRLKNRIDTAKSVLPSISGIDVFRYTLKADTAKRVYIGVSAQQIQGIWSEFVHGVETLSLDYAQMAAYVAIKGLQETKLWMDSKDKKISELEKRIVELEKIVS